MLAVLDVARHVFWNDSLYDRRLLPSEEALEACSLTLTDLATMNGRERLSAFKHCGIDSSLFPLFLRSLQHITAVHGAGSIADSYVIHRHLTARQWSPLAANTPLLGYPSLISEPYRERSDLPFEKNGSQNNERDDIIVSDIGEHYNGLLNQGATCYLNSLLQALFHISEFRSIIYKMPTRDEAEELSKMDPPVAKSIPYALQRLFCMLQTATKALGTTELTESFGWSESDSFIQHDVHELTRVLLDNLDKKLNMQDPNGQASDKSENAINKLFLGTLESYVRVDEVNYNGVREEPFYDLQLVVKNKKDIYASFDSFFQVEVLDGKNKYCLERDGQRTYHRAEKGVRLKKTPPIMLLHLARFDFDWEQGETKIFSRWDYYSTLDLSRYMPHCMPEETHYTLCSVLVHSGSNTGFGHYYCFLTCSGRWYKFNDETVTPATLKEVFGSNFGGYKVNYWGNEVPQIATAYMLVYIRTSELETLLRPIGAADVPVHVIKQLENEQAELERKRKEQMEDYLYGRVHFFQPSEINDLEGFLTYRSPPGHKFSSHRTLRVLLESEALPLFSDFVQHVFGCANEDALLWFTAPRSSELSRMRLHAQVKPGMTVSDVLGGDSECSVLVTTRSTVPVVTLEDESSIYQLFHHKLYDPLRLKVYFLGCTVVKRNPNGDAHVTIKEMEPYIRTMIAALPEESQKYFMHHMMSGRGNAARNAASPGRKLSSSCSMETLRINPELPTTSAKEEEGESAALPTRGSPTGALTVVTEDEHHNFRPCETLQSGDFLVWQLETPLVDQANVFYPNVESFQHFLRHRIPVDIRLNFPPSYPTLISTQLADDMTYEQIQRYVAFLVGETPNYDRIRFTRHNPETDLPYFMKGKKRDRSTLTRLLTPATNRATNLSKCLYYEYCKFTVTEIECAHSLQFKLYCDCVKPVSAHWILMPREVPITAEELFSTCVKEIQRDYATGVAALPQAANSEDAKENNSKLRFIEYIRNLKGEEAWKSLRLADVWRGRVYNVLDHSHPLVFEHQTFEESAEYRIERIPSVFPGVPEDEQSLLQVHHFTMIRQRKDPVETHSEPFSMYVLHRELPEELLRRIAEKLELPFAGVMDWKVCLVKESRVLETKPDVPMGVQLMDFCDPAGFAPNQKDPTKCAFVGLEHAPIAKRGAKREDKVVIFN